MKSPILFLLFLLFPLCGFASPTAPCNEAPVADFVAFGTTGCGPLQIQFFDQSQGDVSSWEWTFPGGDSTTSSVKDPLITYDVIGTYAVSLKVSNADGSDETTKNAYIQITGHEVIIDFSFEKNNQTLTFSNNSLWSDNYVWDFGDGNFSQEKNPVHTYSSDGTYIVRLKGTNECDGADLTDVVVLGCCGTPVSYNANDQVEPYTGGFRPGTNLGYNPPWSDSELADIAAGNEALGVKGAGCKSIRPALPENFVEEYGYDIRIDAYEHYASLKLKDNTCIIGFPSEAHKDPTYHCPEHQSEMFANMYTPIWDNGENGTPVNDTNYLAVYLYKLLHVYKDEVKFWEIWNEPGFDYTFLTGFLEPGFEGNWWENDPTPCDYKLRAPIYDYIRTLRISYEVIKTIQPDAYVTLASVGFPSFLDAVLRNTDNPNMGDVSPEYPLGGGAYFDAIAIHSYPHFDGTLRYWDEPSQSFIYSRHSDKAAKGIEDTKSTFESVLANYGYDGITYPKKEWIITEVNIPRKAFLDFIGSDTAQVNFIMKVYAESVINDIRQIHIYDMAESFEFEDAVNEFQLMGLYKRLFGVFPYNERINNMGIAYKTCSDLLFDSDYDSQRSAQMQLPVGVRGEAFLDHDGHYTYMLWAETTEDLSEDASAIYSFPAAWNTGQLKKFSWEHSYSPADNNSTSSGIQLTARPIFLKDETNTFPTTPRAAFEIANTTGCLPFEVQLQDASSSNVTQWEWTFEGGTPSSSNAQNPLVTYNQAGTYAISLRVSNASGSDELIKQEVVVVDNRLPRSEFSTSIFGKVVTCSNTSDNASSYRWNMGTGEIRTEANPTITYTIPGIFIIELIAYNGCGADTSYQTITVSPENLAPVPDFSADVTIGCSPVTVQFTDQSSDNAVRWWWFFEGGSPKESTQQNPVVTFTEPGSYFVKMLAYSANDLSAEAFKGQFITVDGDRPPVANFESNTTGANASFSNLSTGASSFLWLFGDGQSSPLPDPNHQYADGNYIVTLISTNACGSDTTQQNISIVSPPTANFELANQQGCAPMSIQLDNTSSSNATNFSWRFPGGTPATSTLKNPEVTYTQSGQYSIELTASNEAGENVVSKVNSVLVEAIPQAVFDFQTVGRGVQLEDKSSGANTLTWEFGDGNTSNLLNPFHTYAADGNYTVRLTATNACGSHEFSLEVAVNDQAFPGFSANQRQACAPLQVQFTDASASNTSSWNWQFPGGTPASSNEQNPLVTYNQAGSFDVTLTAKTASDSSVFNQTDFIIIADKPQIVFNTNINGKAVQFSNQTSSANSFSWQFGDGNSSTDIHPFHQYSEPGNYMVSLNAQNDCGESSFSQTISISSLPVAAFETDTLSGCAPLVVQYKDLSSNQPSSWQWEFPGGNPATSSMQNPLVTYNEAGLYGASLEVGNSAGNSMRFSQNSVRVIGDPAAIFEGRYMGDSTFAFTNQSIDATSFIWFFADGTSSQEVNPIHAFPTPGQFFIQLIAFNECGSDTTTQAIWIPDSNQLTAAFSADSRQACAPFSVQFTDHSAGQPEAWDWRFSGGTPVSSASQNPLINYQTPGLYDIRLIVSKSSGEKDTMNLLQYIEVKGLPTANFDVALSNDNQIELTNNSEAATTFFWDFGDGTNSTLAKPNHAYQAAGSYEIVLIASNACGSDTTKQQVDILTVDLPFLPEAGSIRLFPNPNGGQFLLELTQAYSPSVQVRLFNSLGQLILRTDKSINNGYLRERFDLTNFSKGLYLMEVKVGDRKEVMKVLVQ